eukprot:jgi/Ulvmu1/12150/UM085_0014.1
MAVRTAEVQVDALAPHELVTGVRLSSHRMHYFVSERDCDFPTSAAADVSLSPAWVPDTLTITKQANHTAAIRRERMHMKKQHQPHRKAYWPKYTGTFGINRLEAALLVRASDVEHANHKLPSELHEKLAIEMLPMRICVLDE